MAEPFPAPPSRESQNSGQGSPRYDGVGAESADRAIRYNVWNVPGLSTSGRATAIAITEERTLALWKSRRLGGRPVDLSEGARLKRGWGDGPPPLAGDRKIGLAPHPPKKSSPRPALRRLVLQEGIPVLASSTQSVDVQTLAQPPVPLGKRSQLDAISVARLVPAAVSRSAPSPVDSVNPAVRAKFHALRTSSSVAGCHQLWSGIAGVWADEDRQRSVDELHGEPPWPLPPQGKDS